MNLQFDVAGTDLATVQKYKYKYYLDGNKTGTDLAGATAVETNGYYAITAPLPVEAIGKHSVEVSVISNGIESEKSPAFTVDVDEVIPAPANIRMIDQMKL